MTFTKNNFKSPHIFILYSFLVVSSIAGGIFHYQTKRIEILYLLGGIFLFLIILFVFGFMTKIKIEKKGITQSSISQDYLLSWNEIKTIGVYRKGRLGINIVEPKDYDKFSILGQKFIYVSNQKEYLPTNKERVASGFISFHWRKEALNEIIKYCKKDTILIY